MARVDEQRLLQRAKRGDAEAFAALYRLNVQAIYRYIYYRVNDAALAEDLTGDVFTRAIKGMGGYEDQGKPFAAWWIITGGWNGIRKRLRWMMSRFRRRVIWTGNCCGNRRRVCCGRPSRD